MYLQLCPIADGHHDVPIVGGQFFTIMQPLQPRLWLAIGLTVHFGRVTFVNSYVVKLARERGRARGGRRGSDNIICTHT
jgi:hypothetical protein